MTDDSTASTLDHTQSDAARAEASRIADWCESQRTSTETRANAQISVVWVLLIGGLVLLLILPRILQWIDFVGQEDSTPSQILERFNATDERIDDNTSVMEREYTSAEMDLTAALAEIETAEKLEADIIKDIMALLDRPKTIWKRILLPENADGIEFHKIQKFDRFKMVAIGATETNPNSKDAGPPVTSAIVLERNQSGEWSAPFGYGTSETPVRINAIVPSNISRYIFAVEEDGVGKIMEAAELGARWTEAWPKNPNFRGLISNFQNSGYSALGTEDTLDGAKAIFVASQTGGGEWSAAPVLVNGNRIAMDIAFMDSHRPARLLFGGSDIESGQASFMESDGDGTWLPFNSISAGASRVRGKSVTSLIKASDRTIYAATDVGQVLQLNNEARYWGEVASTFAGNTQLVEAPDGTILMTGYYFDRRGSRLEISILDRRGEQDTSFDIALESQGRFLGSEEYGVNITHDGRLVIAGEGFLIESLSDEETAKALAELLRSASIPDDLVVAAPPGQLATGLSHTKGLFRSLSQQRQVLANLRETLAARQSVFDAAKVTLDRQIEVKSDFGDLGTELTSALRAAEYARQITQIATRLAVIGLLIYLVQIVVNRYRYLQRLAGFYQARGQALRMLSVSPDNTLMNGVTLGDLTAMLSPDAIGFDKSAEPPTNHLASLLQAGLKR